MVARLRDADRPILQAAALIERIDLQLGRLTIRLDAHAVADDFAIAPGTIAPDALTIDAPFRERRRGVETCMVLGHASAPVDAVVVRNVARARVWYAQLKAGGTLADIAATSATSVPVVTRTLPLALLSPAIVAAIRTGRQLPELTSRRLRDIDIPIDWTEQARLFEIG